VALSDATGTIASPLTVLQRTGNVRHDHRAIAQLAAEHEVAVVVVGLPLHMNGTRGAAAQAAAYEAEQLATVVGVTVVMFDERRSTVTADQAMIAVGLGARARRKVVDKVAAAVFLQTWLDAGRPGVDP
jgi:putative Holliday junction resolvase